MNNTKLMNVILWGLIAGVIAAFGTYFFIEDKYDATSKVTMDSINVEIPLAKELKTEEILNTLINDNDWNMSTSELNDAVNIEQKNNEYSIHTSFNNKEDSVLIANQYAKSIGSFFQDTEVTVDELSENSTVNNLSTIPKVLYILAGILIGILVGILINVMSNPSNKRNASNRPESIAKYPVIGTIKVY